MHVENLVDGEEICIQQDGAPQKYNRDVGIYIDETFPNTEVNRGGNIEFLHGLQNWFSWTSFYFDTKKWNS